MEIDNKVKIVAPVIEGKIIDTEYDKSNKCLRHLVEWETADDGMTTRWFTEDQLTLSKGK